MIIKTYSIGAGKRRSRVYAICTTPAENGSSSPEEITRFDTMEAAALILRYLSGAELENSEAHRAREIMTQADAKRAADSLATAATP